MMMTKLMMVKTNDMKANDVNDYDMKSNDVHNYVDDVIGCCLCLCLQNLC